MGKYTRSKCGGSRAALGARTRSRSAASAPVGPGAAKRRKQEPEPEASTAARVDSDALLPGQEGCYLHLRSRKLFMPAAATVAPRGDLGAEEASTAMLAMAPGEKAVLDGISRCSSTASSTVDAAAARETTGAEAEVSAASALQSSAGSSDDGRESRETTPSSRPPPVDSSSDLESSQATDGEKSPKRRRSPATTTTASHLQQPRARTPDAAEIDEFFAAAEKAQAQRFAAKYNFDVALGVPLDGGRFEWTPVAAT